MKCVSATPLTLLDRERCFADLDQWVFTTAGGGCITLVHGEAGIGKTALVREFTRRHPERRVLWGSCDDLFTPQALAPLHDIARQTKGTLFETINSGANRDVIFNAVLDDLERGTPATVVFEDMHWADDATLDFLKFLGRRIARTRAMLVITYRDDETDPRHPLRSVIGDLTREHVRRIALTPLSEQSVVKLARQAGHPPSNLHALTGGNPLLVMESLASGAADVPHSIREIVLARALRLPPAAREIAELVCLGPGETAIDLLERVVDLEESAVESCLSIGMTRDESGALRLRHELVRRALYLSLSETRRQALHARVLEILKTDPGVSAACLVHHAAGCGNVGMVLHNAPIAAEHASSMGEHREAAAHYQTALNNVSRLEPGRRANLREKLAHEYHLIDRIAAAHFNALVSGARLKFDRGDWGGCSEDVEAVLRNQDPPPAARIAALTVLARIRTRRGDPDTNSPLEEAGRLAAQLQDMLSLSALAVARAEAAWLLDDRAGVIQAVLSVYQVSSQHPEPRINAELAVWLFRAGALAGRLVDFAEPYASEIAGNWRAAGETWGQLGCPYEHATVLALYGGELEKREALTIFEGLDASPAARAIRKQFRAEGVKRIPRGARPTTQSNPFGLTRREAEVLELLSRGLRNSAIARALFVSQKTVDHHVSAILGKLGVPSRGAAVVATRGPAAVNSQ